MAKCWKPSNLISIETQLYKLGSPFAMENFASVKMNEEAVYILIWKVFQDNNLSEKAKYIACYNLCLKNGEYVIKLLIYAQNISGRIHKKLIKSIAMDR